MNKNLSSQPVFHPERGNMLIYILGAIFLMGILLVVIRGSGQQGNNIDEEALMIRVSEVQRYGADLENAVRMIMQNGYSEADLRFAATNAASAYGLITDDPGRQVFSSEGGAARYRDPPAGIQSTVTPWVFTASDEVSGVGTTCGSADCLDIIAVLPNVTQAFCYAMNERLGVNNPSGVPPRDSGSANISTVFAGSFTYSQVIGDAANDLRGKTEACFEGGGSPATGTYHYYRVLLSR